MALTTAFRLIPETDTVAMAERAGVDDASHNRPCSPAFAKGTWEHIAYTRAYGYVSHRLNQ